jgi:hypothetical protein
MNYLPKDFDYLFYMEINSDLENLTQEEAKEHYLKFGQFENRLYSDSIKKVVYTNAEKSIADSSKLDQSPLPYDFDASTYLILNPDLSNLNENEATNHYLNNGQFEKRHYKFNLPSDFDESAYLILNKDLNKLDSVGAKWHYTIHGAEENRPYKINIPEDFDWKYYVSNNSTAISNGITTEEQAKQHYITCGYKENRPYKINIPEDFDWKYYVSNNSTAISNGITTEEQAKQHYITCGYKEKNVIFKDPIFSFFNENNLFEDDNLFNNLINLCCDDKISDNSYEIYNNCNTQITDCESYFNNVNSTLNLKDLVTHIKNKFNNPFDNIDIFNKYDSFILIIDFPDHFIGGAAFFINSIIAKYKLCQTFLVVRKYKDSIKFTINDEKIYQTEYSESEAFKFLLNIKDRIEKIFINHIIEFSQEFVNSIFSLEKETTTITHDHYWICERPQNFYHQLPKNNEQHIKWKNIDKIISQNSDNIDIFSNFSNKNKFIISTLPDFNKSFERFDTNNEKIVVGVIGAIGDIKGRKLIQLLMKVCENKHNIEFIIFGQCNTNLLENKNNVYQDIFELNEFLIKYKPNVLLETSLWPETYSYTLTLKMITQLPICSIKKKFKGVVENRLSKYDKYYTFSSVNEAIRLIETVKQNFFYTIYPEICYSDFWDKYFCERNNNSIKKELNLKVKKINESVFINELNVVYIGSKIYVSNNPFGYTSTRSIYTPLERFNDTLKTIESVRKYIPNSFIILFDNSIFTPKEYSTINENVNLFINITDDKVITEYTNKTMSKMYGELCQTTSTIYYLEENLKNLKIKHFFKLSGRYTINESFNYDNYDNDYNIFKKNINVTDRKYFYTSFYKISRKNYLEYCKILKELFDEVKICDKYFNFDWEVLLPSKLNYNFLEIDQLGITQNIAVWNQQDKI